jgi:hypothetical protein
MQPSMLYCMQYSHCTAERLLNNLLQMQHSVKDTAGIDRIT